MKKRNNIGHIGAFIRHMRQIRGMSLPALADKAGISKGGLSKIEHGHDFQLSTLKKLCDAMRVDVEFRPKPDKVYRPMTRGL